MNQKKMVVTLLLLVVIVSLTNAKIQSKLDEDPLWNRIQKVALLQLKGKIF
jgi:hypothetical protein